MSLQVASPVTSTRPPRGTVDILEYVDGHVADDFLAIYQAAFAPLKTLAPARQWLTDDEFRHEMQDPSVLKFVARASDDQIVAMALMSTDLRSVPWVSEEYFAHRFPEHYARDAIFYFGALLVRPERQGGPWASYLIEHLYHYVGERRGVGCFDCCGFNVDTVRLPDLITRAGHRVARMDTQLLDRQEYYGVVVEGLK